MCITFHLVLATTAYLLGVLRLHLDVAGVPSHMLDGAAIRRGTFADCRHGTEWPAIAQLPNECRETDRDQQGQEVIMALARWGSEVISCDNDTNDTLLQHWAKGSSHTTALSLGARLSTGAW